MVVELVGLIRREYRKVYDHVRWFVGAFPREGWKTYDNGHQEWEYIEFGYRYDSWERYYRAIYIRPLYDGVQRLLDFARPESIIITNLGMNPALLEGCSLQMQRELTQVESIIHSYHQRGADELPHRGLKDFGFEELPFKRFSPNMAFFYCMLISFFLFETFKEDVLGEVLAVESYASTVRRKALDFAAKIVKTGGEIILSDRVGSASGGKVTQAVWEHLRFEKLWERCQNPIPIVV